jgi:hypothetical protein
VILSAGGLVALAWLLTSPGHGFDFYAYWAVDLAHPYATTGDFGGFHYPPPFVWLAAPFRLVPFEAGYWAWTGLGLASLVWLTGRWAIAWLLFPPVISELYHGNVHLLMAVALVVGFRASPAWAFVGLAKVTTATIALWPLLRHQWRPAGIFLAATLLVMLPTLLISPAMWTDWLDHLLDRAARVNLWGAEIGVPLWLRLPAAIALVAWGARTGRRWVTSPAIMLTVPVLWVHSLAILAALPRLIRADREPS